ncbi:MAG: benzoyl-CoA reductase, bzd-type, subunit O [Thermodesulfobacteriota bacterium]|nr:benzoyl-CoA reductase, bzd-type, subunit O [Thermodesulfobacteriota bacterium]
MTAELEVKYPVEPLKCWAKVKELREKYYIDYLTAHERGGIRWSGGGASIDAIPAGLGRDVYSLTGEPYGAGIGFDKKFAAKCHAATEEAGYPRDLCAYMRNYWGSVLLNEFAFGGPFPEPDFYWQFHGCCSHAKWYQEAARIGGNKKPVVTIDGTSGLYYKKNEDTGEFYADLPKDGIRYVVDQLHESIEKLEKITGRTFRDELLFEAAENHFENVTLWSKICMLNQTIPAPLDEKSMFSLYVLSVLSKISGEYVEFYRELLDEVRDRVDRGIAALATERKRIMSDIQPPWGFLKMFRYLESYGCVSIGSMYSMGLMGIWKIEEDGTLVPRPTPKELGIEIKDRDQCLELLVDFMFSNFWFHNMHEHTLKGYIIQKIYEQWHCDGVMIHYNRGCEGLSLNVAENRLHLIKQGIPVVSYEGNMGDEREFDLAETEGRIDSFMESLGLK